MVTSSVLWLVAGALTAPLGAQQAPSGLVVVRPAEIGWQPVPPVLPPGAEFTMLVGNPGEPGPFVMRVRLPPNYRVGPHRHPVPEYVTILSGTLCIATGERTDYRQGTCLGAGSFFLTPANLAHALWTEGPVEYELHATARSRGPTSTRLTIRGASPSGRPRGARLSLPT